MGTIGVASTMWAMSRFSWQARASFQGESQEQHSTSVGFSKTHENLVVVDELLTYWNLDESENILDELEEVLLMSMCSHSSFSFFNRKLSFVYCLVFLSIWLLYL